MREGENLSLHHPAKSAGLSQTPGRWKRTILGRQPARGNLETNRGNRYSGTTFAGENREPHASRIDNMITETVAFLCSCELVFAPAMPMLCSLESPRAAHHAVPLRPC